MQSIPRRTVDEIIFLHTAESDLRDIFVEGDYDKAILVDYIRTPVNLNVSVWTIDTVEIDDDALVESGRDTNNCERVIYLAKLFEDGFAYSGRAMFIADRDCSAYTGGAQVARDLYFTDYTCMEMYSWNQFAVARFLTIYCNRPHWEPREIMACARQPLESMFAIRAASERLNIRLNWIDRIVCVELVGWIASLDIAEFARRLLSKVGLNERLADLLHEVSVVQANFSSDPRTQIHGHDLVRFLGYLLRKKGVRTASMDSFSIRRALALSVHREELAVQPLFAAVDEFAA